MYIDDYGNEYECEEDYLRTLKKDDRYHFSIPFEYIKKNMVMEIMILILQ